MNAVCARVFALSGIQAAIAELESTFPDEIFGALLDEIGEHYTLTENDAAFLATHSALDGTRVPPVRVFVLLIKDDLTPHEREVIGDRCDAFIDTYGVMYADYPLAAAQQYKEQAMQMRAVDIAFAGRVVPASASPRSRSSRRPYVERNINRERARDMPLRRQREAALQRAEAAEQAQIQINWNDIQHWTCIGPDGVPHAYAIDTMEISLLYNTVCWIFTNRLALYEQYEDRSRSRNTTSLPAGLAAGRWLAKQPVFRALIKSAIRQRMTFPVELYRYLQDHVLCKQTTELAVTQPWNDPSLAHQAQSLAGFLDEPTELPEEIDFAQLQGRELRKIDLG